jgi:hypothetical protein
LCDGHTVEGGGVGAVGQEGGGFGELRNTCNPGVLLVELLPYDLALGSSYGWEDVWLPLVVSVCADTWRRSISMVPRSTSFLLVPKLIFSKKLSALKASVIPGFC